MSTFEPHFTPDEIAEFWGLSTPTIRTIFEKEEGIILIESPETRTKRRHRSMRIPKSVAERVYARITTGRKRFH